MHEKIIIECTECKSTNIIYNKANDCLGKCLDCSKIFLISDRTRAFICSRYEKEFQDRYVMQYKGYNIYRYMNIINEEKYTFWCSSEDSDYYSGINTLDECYAVIDIIICSEKIDI
jgi:ribosomal protein S27E